MGPDPSKLAALEQKMADLGIRPEEITVRFIKSSGRGGQKVNKSSSAVFLRHEPTGLCVKFGRHRSQHLNRFFALRLLVAKIEAQGGGPDLDQENQAKIRRQKQRRRRRAKKKLDRPEDEGRSRDE